MVGLWSYFLRVARSAAFTFSRLSIFSLILLIALALCAACFKVFGYALRAAKILSLLYSHRGKTIEARRNRRL